MGLGVNERCVYGTGEGVAFLESRQRWGRRHSEELAERAFRKKCYKLL